MINPVNGKAVTDLKDPLFDILLHLSIPEMIILDNEPAFKSNIIRSKLAEYNVQVYETPTGKSEVNGQVERLHSSLTEIYRCLKTDKISNSVKELMKLSVEKYNNAIHSVIRMTPREALFGRKELFDNAEQLNIQREKDNKVIHDTLVKKQNKDRENQNRNKTKPKSYNEGEKVLLKNKQIKGKHVNPKKEIVIKKNQKVTVIDERNHKYHKSDIQKINNLVK